MAKPMESCARDAAYGAKWGEKKEKNLLFLKKKSVQELLSPALLPPRTDPVEPRRCWRGEKSVGEG